MRRGILLRGAFSQKKLGEAVFEGLVGFKVHCWVFEDVFGPL